MLLPKTLAILFFFACVCVRGLLHSHDFCAKCGILCSSKDDDTTKGNDNGKTTANQEGPTLERSIKIILDDYYEDWNITALKEKMTRLGIDWVPKPPNPYSHFPNFKDGDEKISLNDSRGDTVKVMVFPYRMDFPGCPDEIVSLSENLEEFRLLRCEGFACSTDSEQRHLAWSNISLAWPTLHVEPHLLFKSREDEDICRQPLLRDSYLMSGYDCKDRNTGRPVVEFPLLLGSYYNNLEQFESLLEDDFVYQSMYLLDDDNSRFPLRVMALGRYQAPPTSPIAPTDISPFLAPFLFDNGNIRFTRQIPAALPPIDVDKILGTPLFYDKYGKVCSIKKEKVKKYEKESGLWKSKTAL